MWKAVTGIEELDCWFGTHTTISSLSSLGPAPNLKVFLLRDGLNDAPWNIGWQKIDLPVIFRGGLPSL